ncbi:hypothetical protein CJ739_1117 [Mariniflexile rhizosphaerae]|nr:hypothetical protein CJ739_1117 [Mariniflexile sp. TRM1-10]
MLNRLEFSNEVYKSTELYHFQKLKLLRVLNKKNAIQMDRAYFYLMPIL